jgi:hypothetical protein
MYISSFEEVLRVHVELSITQHAHQNDGHQTISDGSEELQDSEHQTTNDVSEELDHQAATNMCKMFILKSLKL